MNKCPSCGKDMDDKNRFCSLDCYKNSEEVKENGE
jgi:hypothetical protein